MRKTATKRLLCVLLTLVLVVGLLPATALGATVKVTPTAVSADKLSAAIADHEFDTAGTIDEDATVRAIVVFDGDGTVPTVTASANGARKAQARPRTLSQVLAQHQAVKTELADEVNYTVQYEFTALLNGMSIDVAAGDLDKIAAMDGVKKVYLANYYEVPTTETPSMDSSNDMTGISWIRGFGDTGKGTVIAVLDTGITLQHEAFQVAEDDVKRVLGDVALASNDIAAFQSVNKRDYGVYVSEKIPFAYDYKDHDNDPTDENGHGTHVAGIAAGYVESEDGAITFAGSAPGAQILAMKIFGATGGTSSDIYFKALEDAYLLGADVVNMSLGSQNGFIYDTELEDEVYGNIYQKLKNAGVICCIAAGNEYSMMEYSEYPGAGAVVSDYQDYGTVASPSTYTGNLSIASVENAYMVGYALTAGGKQIGYTDTTDGEYAAALAEMTKDAGLEFVAIPNNGEEADYEGLDVKGKVALIQRGGISFSDKVLNAEKAGAVAAIIYNNAAGVIRMALEGNTIPAVSITQEDGAYLLSLTDSATVTFLPGEASVANPSGGLMSDFSGWGCTPSLTLAPQLSGVGGNIYSAAAGTTDGYVTMSGTSMATPDVAGAMASMLGYLRGKYSSKSDVELAEMAEALYLSSASLVKDENNWYYSPRKQGAGLIDAHHAEDLVESRLIYITDPICNIGDDADRTGHFQIKFHVQDLRPTWWDDDEDEPDIRSYSLSWTFLFDSPFMITQNGVQYGPFVDGSAASLDPDDVKVTSNCEGNVLKIGAAEEKEVVLDVQLSADAMDSLDLLFPNGNFVEGFVTLSYDAMPLANYNCHATFMGFYGDWTEASVMEPYSYIDVLEGEDFYYTAMINRSFLAEVNGSSLSATYGFAGDNAFSDDMPFDADRIAVSSPAVDDGEKLANYLFMPIYPLRNARHLIMVVSDAETGEVYYYDDTEYLPKAVYDTENGYWSYTGTYLWDGTKDNGKTPVANNTKVNIDFYASVAYGDDELGKIAYADLREQGEAYREWSYQCTVDSEAPVVADEAEYDPTTGELTLYVSDNQYLSYVTVMDTGYNPIDNWVVAGEKGAKEELTFDIGKNRMGKLIVMCSDYATNLSAYTVSLDSITSDIDRYTVTLDTYPADKGTVSGDGVYYDGVAATVTATPNEGETFYGWYDGKEIVSTDASYTFTVTSDVTLTALFVQPHYVTFDANGAMGSSKQMVFDGETVQQPADPTRPMFRFLGWYKDGVLYDFSTPVHESFTLTAKWVRHDSTQNPVEPAKPGEGGTVKLPFADISQNDWFYEDVAYVYENGLMSGTGAWQFSPNGEATRGMIVSILWRLEGKPAAGANAFTDVAAGSYYEDAIAWAAANGIVSGTSKTTFAPDDAITREQLASILFRYASYKGYDVSARADLSKFVDAAQVSAYAKDALSWANATSLISGKTGAKLDPTGLAVRAEVAAILHRFCEQVAR